jgi:TatD DNase family protein
MFDAHTHLDNEILFPNWRKHLDCFIQSWWKWLVTVWTDAESIMRNVTISRTVDDEDIPCLVKSTAWYHPSVVINDIITDENLNDTLISLYESYSNHDMHIVAIGECWIDLHYEWSRDSLLMQQKLFAWQCQLALQLGLPLVIHSRDAFEETMIVLRDFPDLVVYFHCRWYWKDELEQVLSSFSTAYIWFCWNVTYKNSAALRESLSLVPVDSLLLETDAPYLTIQEKRGQFNAPDFIWHLYKYVAEYLSLDCDDLIDITGDNFRRIYQLW